MTPIEIQYHLKHSLGKADPGQLDGIIGSGTRAAITDTLRQASGVARTAFLSPSHEAVAIEQLIMRDVGGIRVAVDGFNGPETEAARDRWNGGNWRDVVNQYLEGDHRLPTPVKTIWPRQSELRKKLGEPGFNLTMMEFPYPMRLAWDLKTTVNRTQVHKTVHDSAQRVFKRILDHYGYETIQTLRLDHFGGCFNIRPIRGGSAPSTHSWGIAFDIDPANNQLRWGRDRATLAVSPLYDAYWDAWTEEGWVSLGKARNYDWMHVQAARLG